jgi:antirestriction protein
MEVFVSTYKKYAEGRIVGAWVEISSPLQFNTEIEKLHSDEADPEFMFQDYKDTPKALRKESAIDSRIFEYADLSETDMDIVATWWEENDSNTEITDILNNYVGTYADPEEYAREVIEEMGVFEKYPNLENFFDFADYARELEHDCTILESVEHNQVYVFNNY